jgi:DNA-binding CsgD family transcriptional regulator
MMALTIILLGQTITSYNIINIVQSSALNAILNIASYVAASFIIYFLALFAYEVVEKEWTSKKKLFFKAASLLPITCLLIYYITPYKNLMNMVSSSILFLSIVYDVVFIYANYKHIKNEYIKYVLKKFLVITVLFFPYMYLDTRSEKISILNKLFPYGLLSLPIFYMVWNLLSMYFTVKKFKALADESNNSISVKDVVETQNKQDEFFRKFNITNREKEIISLLIKGYSYNKLAEELSISLTTVKTHVHNIYRKVEVKNKIQLIHLINGEEIKQDI